MKTDDLILMLAQGDVAVPRHVVAKRLGMALGIGLMASFGLMLAVLGLRPDLESASMLTMFWVKLAFALSMGLIGLIAVKKIARPDGTIKHTLWATAFPIGLIWLLSLILVAHAPSTQRWHRPAQAQRAATNSNNPFPRYRSLFAKPVAYLPILKVSRLDWKQRPYAQRQLLLCIVKPAADWATEVSNCLNWHAH